MMTMVMMVMMVILMVMNDDDSDVNDCDDYYDDDGDGDGDGENDGDGDTLKIEMTSNVAFKHPSMNRKSDTFREIFKDVDANAKLACEARLVEAFEIIEIHELSTYEKSTFADRDKDDNDEKMHE